MDSLKINKIIFFIIIYLLSFCFLLIISNFVFGYFILFYFITALSYIYITFNLKKLKSNYLFIFFSTVFIVKFFFIFKTPLLSDDIYRYIWEGKIFLKGFNPYITAPNSSFLTKFRDIIWIKINHKNFPAIYPPFNILINAFLSIFSSSLIFYKFFLFIIDLLTFFIIILILNHINLPLRYSFIYFANPLTILEIEWSGHNDILMIFFLSAALYFFIKKQYIKSYILYSLSILIKFIPLAFLKEFLRKKFLLIFLIIVIFSYLPFISFNKNIFFSLEIYSTTWEFNSFFYNILKIFINNNLLIRVILLLIFILMFIYINFKIKNIFQRLLYITLSLLLCSPTVHPWYGLWLIPFLCFYLKFEILIFTIILPLSYQILENYFSQKIWHENLYITFIIYTPLLFLFIKKIYNFFKFNRKNQFDKKESID